MRYRNGEIDMEHIRSFNGTPEANAKKVHRGVNHPRYKHDRSMIKSPRPRYELTAWRTAVFERDNYTCQDCGVRGGRIQAHHIKSYAAFPEFRWDVDNGRTLCESCHKKTKNYGAKATQERCYAV
jgi:5-methylcytosine-specific restriction endonuclease McrA